VHFFRFFTFQYLFERKRTVWRLQSLVEYFEISRYKIGNPPLAGVLYGGWVLANITAQERKKIKLDAHDPSLKKAIFGNGFSLFKWLGASWAAWLILPNALPFGAIILAIYLMVAFFRYFSARETDVSKRTKALLAEKTKEEQARMDKIAADEKCSKERTKAITDRAMAGQREREANAKEMALIETEANALYESNAAKIKAIEAELDADLA